MWTDSEVDYVGKLTQSMNVFVGQKFMAILYATEGCQWEVLYYTQVMNRNLL